MRKDRYIGVPMAAPHAPEKLWRYTSLLKVVAWVMIVVGALVIPMSMVAQAADPGVDGGYVVTILGTTLGTGVLFVPLLHMWMRKSRPSAFLPRAEKLRGPRRIPASRRDLVRWGVTLGVFLFIATVLMVSFLVGVLETSGADGIAEGAVAGLMMAWGLFTLGDARRIARTEAAEGRTYFTVAHRPTAAGNRLMWTVSGREPSADSPN
jgi:hypothetical protein